MSFYHELATATADGNYPSDDGEQITAGRYVFMNVGTASAEVVKLQVKPAGENDNSDTASAWIDWPDGTISDTAVIATLPAGRVRINVASADASTDTDIGLWKAE
jgi:hypothetical protein